MVVFLVYLMVILVFFFLIFLYILKFLKGIAASKFCEKELLPLIKLEIEKKCISIESPNYIEEIKESIKKAFLIAGKY